jgi:RNA polymerase sigma-70 factor (ECF subfamily)
MRGEASHDALSTAPGGRDEPTVVERDEALAGRAGRGDLAALSGLLARWREPLVRYCRRLLRHEEDARDLAHDVLLRVTRGLERYDPARPFAPWIYRIARNTCLHHVERQKVRGPTATGGDRPGPTPPPDVLVARQEEVARVRRALARLPRGDRKLLEMKLVRGLGNAEMAESLGLTSAALRSRASRALGRLRRELDAAGGGDRP